MLECSECKKIEYETEHFHLLTNDTKQDFDCVLTYARAMAEMEYDKMPFLDKEDLNYIDMRRRTEQKQDVAVGRFAVKKAVAELTKSELSAVHVRKGIFNQPIVSLTDGFQQYETHVSVSHSRNRAVSVAFPPELIIGIDLEDEINYAAERVMKLSDTEKAVLKDYEFGATSIWAIREALIKCLKTNIFFSSELMELNNIEFENGYLSGTFKNFSQNKFLLKKEVNSYLSFVYPSRTVIKSGKL